MIRWALWLLGGLLLGGIVHLASVLLLPRTATQDAYTRLSVSAPGEPHGADAGRDPGRCGAAFDGPRVRVVGMPLRSRRRTAQIEGTGQPSLYGGIVLYAKRRRLLCDQRSGRGTPHHRTRPDDGAARAELPDDEEVTAADRLIVNSPTATGLIVVRALAPEPGLMPQAQATLAASSCKVQTEPPPPKQVAPASAPPPAKR